jgi:hypothetical protein
MKMKKIIILLLLSIQSYTQDLVSSFELKLKSNKDVFQIVDESTKQVNFFVSDRKKIFAFILDSGLEIKDSLSTDRPERKFKDIVGYSSANGKKYIYWATDKKDEIFSQEFDFSNRKTRGISIGFSNGIENETYLESFASNNNFFILKINKITKSLQLFELSNGIMNSYTINTNSMKFFDKDNQQASIYKIINNGDSFVGYDSEKKLSKIITECPSTLTESARKRKLYVINNFMYITIDNSNLKTQILKVDLATKESHLLDVDKPIVNNLETEIETNSFLVDNKIFQIVVTPKKMHLVGKDFSGNLIKEYVINENDKFGINNTPFVRERITGSERELETTSQFLRKIVRSNLGLAIYPLYDNYLITLGSVSAEMRGGGAPMMGMGGFGMPMGGGMTMMMPSPANFMMMGYYSYKGRRSISTKCLFNKELSHIPVELKDLAFDKIKKYEDDYNGYTSLKLQTIFRIGSDYYFGCYDGSISQYSFRKFKD